MKSINERLLALERAANDRNPPQPAVIAFWPEDAEGQARLEAEVELHTQAGRRVIIFRAEDRRAGAPDPEQLPEWAAKLN